MLERAGLTTIPDFESSWIDGQISFALVKPETKAGEGTTGGATLGSGTETPATPSTPTELTSPEEKTGAELPPATEHGSPMVGPEGATGESTTIYSFVSPETSVHGVWHVNLDVAKDFVSVRVGAGDPTHRISKLEAANRPPVSVSPDGALNEAVTIMLANDFSQIPVMEGERDVKGVVSWQSIGSRLAFGLTAATAREVMDRAVVIRSDASIFDAIPIVGEQGYVLVRGPDERIVGIVTSSDLNSQFQQLAEPFLLLSEIENRVRNFIAAHFTSEELAGVRDPDDDERVIGSVDDLTFGEYIRLLEEPDRWGRVNLPLDRKYFIKSLDNVRRIRNDVMHFDPDGIPLEDTEALRDFARFLRTLKTLGVT